MNQLDTINEMLDAIREFVGYRLYLIEYNGIESGTYRLDVYGADNTKLVHAERMGSLNEIYMYVAGMYRIITLVQTRMGINHL